MSPLSVSELASRLTAMADEGIVALLAARPDLIAPPSASLTALAARAGGRASAEAAMAHLDAPTLAVAEAVVALDAAPPDAAPPGDGAGPDAPAIAAGLGLAREQVDACLEELGRLALVVGGRPTAGLAEAFGPHPLGLAPGADPVATLPPSLEELRAAQLPDGLPDGADDPGGADSEDDDAAGAPGGSPHALRLPEASVDMAEVLAWGPPVGTLRPGGKAPAAQPLIDRGWLVRSADAQGRTRLVMPRDVALALRGGRLSRRELEAPRAEDLQVVDMQAVGAEAAFSAEESVRLVGALLEEWRREPGPILRSGGVGVRALTRTAEAMGLDGEQAASIIEVAAGADLLGLDDSGANWLPSHEAGTWRTDSLARRWATLVLGWARSARTPWLVGARDDAGALRSVLSADLEAGWVRRLRARILALLAGLPEGAVATPAFVRAALTHERPRRRPPEGAVSAILAEARMLGITGAGALSGPGRILARAMGAAARRPGAEQIEAPPEAGSQPEAQLLADLEAALEADIPAAVNTLLVQSDLTAIVPGRPGPVLAALLERTAAVESRGGALGVRFTPESVRAAMDAGHGAPEILADLARFSPSPLPSALTALVEDASRRHGAVRVRQAASILRIEDPAVAARVLAEPRLSSLGIGEIAPGILVSTAPAFQVLRELRRIGMAPALEDSQGRLVTALTPAEGPAVRAVRPARPGGAYRPAQPTRMRELPALVRRMRQGEDDRAAQIGPAGQGGQGGPASDPVHAMAMLRQAQASRARLRLRLAAADGTAVERRVRVVGVEPGRVRLRDLGRETELTVAPHRIIAVAED
ncbi:helicase-associated domain-containing protein [Actinomyces slackii]|uniref:Helicase XPB/Ssl2 N-terminal domain-containing protein n=1 Tax=Actinomyces slackii TaxID=52774 RepID=A0A448KBF3_9ACTO|nr:helicase-associated domain-containing protein [Actinomyces slackii]VEG74241.1 Uncharacterised protein [Actinomyces slackii]